MMNITVYLENQAESEFGFDPQEVSERVVTQALDSEHCPFEKVCVNILITDATEIRELNRDYRGIDSATDVLSFPNLDFAKGPSVFEIPKGRESDYLDPDTGECILGDMILCEERIRSQAEEYGHSVLREFAFLIAHSMLHLCGYDHMEDGERERMEAKQEEILTQLGITRDV